MDFDSQKFWEGQSFPQKLIAILFPLDCHRIGRIDTGGVVNGRLPVRLRWLVYKPPTTGPDKLFDKLFDSLPDDSIVVQWIWPSGQTMQHAHWLEHSTKRVNRNNQKISSAVESIVKRRSMTTNRLVKHPPFTVIVVIVVSLKLRLSYNSHTTILKPIRNFPSIIDKSLVLSHLS